VESAPQPSPSSQPEHEAKVEGSLSDSLQVRVFGGGGSYQEGTKVGVIDPIEWKSYYSELQVWLENTSPRDYEHFDVSIDTDQVIVAASQLTNVPGVSIFQRGQAAEPLTPPITRSDNRVVRLPMNIVDSPRSIRCEIFPHKTPIHLAFAVVNYRGIDHLAGRRIVGFGQPELEPKILPKWVKIAGSYKQGSAEITVSTKREITQASFP
jgi:hypothetical protein